MARKADGRRQVYTRLDPDDYERAKYWAQRNDMSLSEFVAWAVRDKIRHANGDYDLPTAEIQRLNQLTMAIQDLAGANRDMLDLVNHGMHSILVATRGDNYLLDQDIDVMGRDV